MINTNYDKINLPQVVTKWARNVMAIHPIRVEWIVAITGIALIKLITMIFSAYAAYTFFYDYAHQVIKEENLSIVISLLIICLLELVTAVFLTKTYKFFFRKKYKVSMIVFLIAICLYSISFYSSTNGLAKKQARKKDNTLQIEKEWKNKRDVLTDQQSAQLQEIDLIIKDIRNNPNAWYKSKRRFLTTEQQKNIIELENKKSSIRQNIASQLEKEETQYQEGIEKNNTRIGNTAKEYYQIMAVVMLVQFFITGILIYLLHLVHLQENREDIIAEELSTIQDTIQKQTAQYIQKGMSQALNNFFLRLTPSGQNDKEGIQKSGHTQNLVFEHKYMDFLSPTSSEEYANSKHGKKESGINDRLNKHEKYLAKHKHIVQAIDANINRNQEFLSNKDIKTKILPSIKEIKYKSPSLIRKVFVYLKASGYEDFNSSVMI